MTEVYDAIPPDELEHATIGSTPVKNMPEKEIRFFRGSKWNEKMLRFAAEKINTACHGTGHIEKAEES